MKTDNLSEVIIISTIEQGLDYLIKRAKLFVDNNNLCEISQNQLTSLRSEVEKGENFVSLQKSVKDWLKKQTDKKSGEKWVKIQPHILKNMFDWQDIITLIKNNNQKILNEQHPLIAEFNALLTEENIKNDLNDIKFLLAKKFFFTVFAIYRCYKDKDVTITSKIKEYIK